tara:strand:+ start:1314 stop:1565 length:252 start_codon:yes stop_codon:yes gene_type:complete
MSWKEVTAKSGKKESPAFLRDDVLSLPNVIGQPTSVTVDGKSRKVASWELDTRDNIINIQLEPLNDGKKEKGEPDGESVESTS